MPFPGPEWKQNASTPSPAPSPISVPGRKIYGGIFDYDVKVGRLAEVNGELEDPEVWNNPKRAQDLGKEKKALDDTVGRLQTLGERLRDTRELFDLAREEGREILRRDALLAERLDAFRRWSARCRDGRLSINPEHDDFPALLAEALDHLEQAGNHVNALRVRSFPFSTAVEDFIHEHDKVFIVEQNRDAQLRTMLMADFTLDARKLIPVLHYDGTPITARFIASDIAKKLARLKVVPFEKAAS